MMTKLYWSIVNNEIKMPNQVENKVVELPPAQKEHIALLSCVQTHIALLKEYRVNIQLFDKGRSSDTIETLFRCIWLELDIYLDVVLVKGHLQNELLAKSLDILRFCLMSCWFLSLDAPEKSFVDVMTRVTGQLRDSMSQELQSEAAKDLDVIDDGEKEDVVKMLHLEKLISLLKDCYSASLDLKKVEDKMELFKPGSVPEAEGRKFLYDGVLTKRTHRGVLKEYRVSGAGRARRVVLLVQRHPAVREDELAGQVQPPPHRPARGLRTGRGGLQRGEERADRRGGGEA